MNNNSNNSNNPAATGAAGAAAGTASAGSGQTSSAPPATSVAGATSSSTTATASASGAGATSSSTATAATASAASTTTSAAPTVPVSNKAQQQPPPAPPTTDQIVLDYLRRKGMNSAVLELTSLLKKKDEGDDESKSKDEGATTAAAPTTSSTTAKIEAAKKADASSGDVVMSDAEKVEKKKSIRARLEEEDELNRAQRTLLTKSTGGGYGYDRDSAWPIVQWGIPDTSITTRKSGGDADKKDETTEKDKDVKQPMGLEEAQAYLEAFVNLQLWVLSLPDVDGVQRVDNPLRRAQEILKQHETTKSGASEKSYDDGTLQAVMEELTKYKMPLSTANASTVQYNLAPSVKPELLTVTFALLVHTYCEILEVGCESTAHLLRDAFQPVYEPLFGSEFRDLQHCTTAEQIMRLNQHNSQHMESLAALKTILVQVASYQLRRQELNAQTAAASASSNLSAEQRQAREMKIKEYDRNIGILKSRYTELSQRASAAFDKMHDLPFLRRARAVRWQLSLSTQTYALLASFLNSGRGGHDDNALLAMSTLLQTKCILNVERRDPLPYTPACVLDGDYSPPDSKSSKSGSPPPSNRAIQADKMIGTAHSSRAAEMRELQEIAINWAAPSVAMTIQKSQQKSSVHERIPFPKYHLDDEYDDENQARRDKKIVEFNRSLLINGFRRLEALERKREYEALTVTTTRPPQKRAKEGGDAGGTADGGGAAEATTESSTVYPPPPGTIVAADPLEPTILLTTLCAASSTPSGGAGATAAASSRTSSDAASIWDEPGVGICCAKICPPDGRRVAAGCDDSAIRIWNLAKSTPGSANNSNSTTGEPCEVLLGHKNGFPVFDVAWNRDGRTLLSAGGDGSIRLWDTMAVGPFGAVSPVGQSSTATKSTGSKTSAASKAAAARNAAANAAAAASHTSRASRAPDMSVPGLKAETAPYRSGAAIAVYRGHVPSTPVWSVAFAPCGYYFASAGGDGTARLWTTDRSVPVRLFTGHTAGNVNCVAWHPNANYIITGSDDKTARLWDIQTGRTVRLLTGCSAGINVVCISPEGRLAAAADHTGCCHLWDLSTGKKVCEFRVPQQQHYISSGGGSSSNNTGQPSQSMIHTLCFSGCGTTLATAGDDCCVRIWDVRSEALEEYNAINTMFTMPAKAFRTRRTMLLDLEYTSRNLLLSVGKFITPIPMAATRIPP